jgi:hypothetical protein
VKLIDESGHESVIRTHVAPAKATLEPRRKWQDLVAHWSIPYLCEATLYVAPDVVAFCSFAATENETIPATNIDNITHLSN